MTVMVVGSSGMLGSRLMKLLGSRAAGFDLPDFDVTDPGCVRKTVARVRPDVIINASAITDVDYCEQNPEAAERVHHYGVRNLAVSGVRLVSVSTDQVFNDGRGLYIPESHPAEPVNVYAASKLRGRFIVSGECHCKNIMAFWKQRAASLAHQETDRLRFCYRSN
jgi:dTDP-4-dehydrorhamnose reductase